MFADDIELIPEDEQQIPYTVQLIDQTAWLSMMGATLVMQEGKSNMFLSSDFLRALAH